MRYIKFLLMVFLSTPVWAEPISIAEKLVIDSKVFGQQRTIRVSLPKSYQVNPSATYPIIYVVRGQLEHLITLASIDLLDQEVPQFIVVGIDGNGSEFAPRRDGEATNYTRFLHDEVVPFIEEEYRVAPFSVMLGHSAAGLFAVNNWYDRGDDFSAYIAISPPFDHPSINGRAETFSEADIDTRNSLLVTLANERNSATKSFAKFQEIFAKQQKVSFASFPDQTHMSTRANAIMHGLRAIFPNWKHSINDRRDKLQPLLDHYIGLSERYGFNVDVPQDTLNRMAAFQSWEDDTELNKNAADTVNYVLGRNPDDINELFEMVKQSIDFGQEDGAKRLRSYICRRAKHDDRCTSH